VKPGSSDLLWCDCGDGYVVYDQLTGNTHALDSLAAALLRRSLAGMPPADPAGISAVLSDSADPQAVQAARDQLVSCGLL
jgi:hypothetical protein